MEPDEPEHLLGRLKDVVSGDTALRQLRRRYDALRHDYETLLDRVDELEASLAIAAQQAAQGQPLGEQPQPVSPDVSEGLVSPLLRLRDDYLAAAGGIQTIVDGLDGLAAAAFKGQRGPGVRRPEPTHEHPVGRPRTVQVDVNGGDFGELLDFQEQLSNLPAVERVSIKAIDNERATLVVELRDS
ncbi:MAG: hypothetical protein WEC33_06295 [Dehalococcoidia bacterium]